MPVERVSYRGRIFARKSENDAEWEARAEERMKPFAACSMEVTGESAPTVLVDVSALNKLTADTPQVYHYTWTLGLTGLAGLGWLEQLDEADAVLVQLIVQTGASRYVPREMFGTLEYLPPTRTLMEKPSLLEWARGLVLKTGDVVEAAGAKLAGSVLSTIGNIIPPDRGDGHSRWYLNTFDLQVGTDVAEHAFGIEWHVSRALIQEIGTRLVGRLGLVFLDAPIQGETDVDGPQQICIHGRFGIKHVAEGARWYGFSMLPRPDSSDLTLRIDPVSQRPSAVD